MLVAYGYNYEKILYFKIAATVNSQEAGQEK